MTRTLARSVGTTTVTVEPFAGVDGQGQPTYGASDSIEGRVVHSTGRSISSEGQDIRTDLVVWVDVGASTLPDTPDRLTVDGDTYIVVDHQERKRLDGNVDHVRIEAREE